MLVWLAQNLQVSVDDPTLNMIIPPASVASLGTCTDPIYQRTSLHATCDFVGGGTAITGVDVTSLVTFNIPDSSKDLAVVVNHYVQVLCLIKRLSCVPDMVARTLMSVPA